MASALHAVDVDTTAHMVIQTPKGVVQRTITALIEFIRELGYKRCIIRSDNEPAITAMTAEVGKQREEETVIEEIQVANSRAVGVVERGNRTVGSLARAYRSAFDKNYGFQLMPAMAVTSWLLRHVAWVLNRYCVGRDGLTPYERYKGRPYMGEVCELFEKVHWIVPSAKEHKFENRTEVGLWLGKTSKGDSHLVFNDEVHQVRTVQRLPEERRWDKRLVEALDAFPWLPRPPRVRERTRNVTWAYVRRYGGDSWLQGVQRGRNLP